MILLFFLLQEKEHKRYAQPEAYPQRSTGLLFQHVAQDAVERVDDGTVEAPPSPSFPVCVSEPRVREMPCGRRRDNDDGRHGRYRVIGDSAVCVPVAFATFRTPNVRGARVG